MDVPASQWKQIKEIYQRVAELPDDSRGSMLNSFCGDNHILRREVESLLKCQTESDELFDDPVFNVSAELRRSDETFRNGSNLNNYTIKSEIGRGGMGVVYLAERSDGQFNQKAAIKIIKRGMDTDAVLKRFMNERQILASLDHPYIARLLDGGTTPDGLPYFVMEYISGAPIRNFCKEKNLGLSERLSLFRKVCEAVSYAHQNLVVHRDLKPSNILITENGDPKLLDFGIAKVLHTTQNGDTELTNTVHRMLTPEYASPEQVRGDRVTTRSDVFSLGILLRKLLTDFNAKRDLQVIINKAVHPETERRYSSVEQLSEDLYRYLNDLPVLARKDSLAYRCRKFIFRHAAAVLASIIVLLILIGSTVFSLSQARRANAAQRLSQQRFDEVRKLANAVLFDYHDGIEKLAGSTEVRQRMLRDSLIYLNSLSSDASEDPGLLAEIGKAYLKIGDLQGKPYAANAGDTGAAIESYKRAEDIFQSLLSRDPQNFDYQIELSRAFEAPAKIVMRDQKADLAVSSHRKALEIRETLASRNPGNVSVQSLLADSYFNLGDALGVKSGLIESTNLHGRFELLVESNNMIRRSYEIRGQLALQNPDDSLLRHAVAACLQRLAFRSSSFGDFKRENDISAADDPRTAADFYREAVLLHSKAIDIGRQIQSREPDNARIRRFVADEQMILAEPLGKLGEFITAETNLKAAVGVFEELAARDPSNLEAKRDLVNLYDRLGQLYVARRNAVKAISHFRQAAEFSRQVISVNANESDRIQLKGLEWWVNNTLAVISRQPDKL